MEDSVHITNLREVRKQNSKQAIEMVLMDQTGTNISVTLWQELFAEFRHTTTSIKEIQHPEIPPNVYMITLFADIISGVAPHHTLVDIVGVVADLIDVKTINPPHRMTVKLRDNRGSSQSQSSQSKLVEKFLHNAQVDCYYLTVGTVDEIIIDAPWSYDSCPYCTTTFDPSKVGSACRSCQNRVNDTVPRYKLNVRMKHNGNKGNFIFWDATCIKMFGKTVAKCRDELIAAGDDIKVFPSCVDEILSKTWAIRFKYHSQLRQSCVLDASEEPYHIQTLTTTLGLKVITN
ncbi:hypothetical protein glysoja_046065 [Glycine soja]|uniref:DUF223 domain-containing protein n=2 Tax=Glycine soja TaxID=3848 RepID=A0A0B2QSY6_GLYSO|nr:hypothetical protein glysoja_046065 [Glycine soja]